MYENMYQEGIIYVKDLYQGGKIMTCETLMQLYDCNIGTLQYNSLISAIPKSWRKIMQDYIDCEEQDTALQKLIQFTK